MAPIGSLKYPALFFAPEAEMNRLVLPAAIFASVLLVGKLCEHYGLDTNLKVGLLCLVAAAVQIGITRYQRSRRDRTDS
jgi:hypothetical protein